MIDVKLKEIEKLQTNAQFEADLKLHICGFAAREFQKMHEDFIKDNDPRKHLEKSKPQYSSDFIDLYHEKDQSLKKAEEFTELCLKPAVREYVNKALGLDIVDEMLTGADSLKYSTRSYFQHSILKQLLEDNKCEKYVAYSGNYEGFVKGWILNRIIDFFKFNTLSDLELKRLEAITQKIQATVKRAENEGTSTYNIKTILGFVENVCSILSSDIVISTDDLGLKLIQDKVSVKEFVGQLQYYLEQMKISLSDEFSQGCDVEKKLRNLPFNPQDVLFKRVFGCGKLCPFCKVPCEAGGKDHKQHHASVHRPQGLGRYSYERSDKLVETVCTTDVHSDTEFKSPETQWKSHPYKDYRRFYPDWLIAPDASIEASDYWKYVLTAFNKQFAEQYHAQPADIPAEWKNITKEQALKSTLSHEPKVLQESLLQLDGILSSLELLHRPIDSPGGSVLLRELASAGNVTDATLSAQATPLLHSLTSAHAYIMMFVHTCRVGQMYMILLDVEEADRKQSVFPEENRSRFKDQRQRKVHLLFRMLKEGQLDKELLPFLSHDAALEILTVVSNELPLLMTRDTSPDESLPVLYPPLCVVIGGLSFTQLIRVLRGFTAALPDSKDTRLSLACQNKFGISFLYALLSQGERLLSSETPMEPSIGDFESWTDIVFLVAKQLSQMSRSSLVEPLLLPSNLLSLFCRYLDKQTVHQLEDNME
ncbi:UNVERIFIED_CONTAM: hypothetical protein FKN15_046362 [Acipenser sinensis]